MRIVPNQSPEVVFDRFAQYIQTQFEELLNSRTLKKQTLKKQKLQESKNKQGAGDKEKGGEKEPLLPPHQSSPSTTPSTPSTTTTIKVEEEEEEEEYSLKSIGDITGNSIQAKMGFVGDWWLGDPSNQIFKAAEYSIEKVWGMKPNYIREGGTIQIGRAHV